MSKFQTKRGKSVQSITTASLPDIIFILLFFFMMVTVLRTKTVKLDIQVPKATELQKLHKKHLISYIYIGYPLGKGPATSDAKIQLDDQFATIEEVQTFIERKRSLLPEALIPYMTVSLKVDRSIKMGIVSDVKQELRKANALKVNYSVAKRIRGL